MSARFWNTRPANPGRFGNGRLASTWSMSIASARAIGSQQFAGISLHAMGWNGGGF